LQPKSVATATAKTSSFLPTINKQNLAADTWKNNSIFWLSCGVYAFDLVQAFNGFRLFDDAGVVQIGALAQAVWGVGGPEGMLLVGSLFAYGRLNRREARHMRRMQREAIVATEQQQGVAEWPGQQQQTETVEAYRNYRPEGVAKADWDDTVIDRAAANGITVTRQYSTQAEAEADIARRTAAATAAGESLRATSATPGYVVPEALRQTPAQPKPRRQARRTDRFARKQSDGAF
jgi:hypothetical protein